MFSIALACLNHTQSPFSRFSSLITMSCTWVKNGSIGRRQIKRFICALGEKGPRQTCKSKNYIEKVHAFVSSELAKRKSPNRMHGTMVTKAMTSVTRDDVRRST